MLGEGVVLSGCVRLLQPDRRADGEWKSLVNYKFEGSDSAAIDETHSPGGWRVVVLGRAHCGQIVGRCLDAIAARDFIVPASVKIARELAWATLPSAAVVAVHDPSGVACLLRDAAGFCPLYYCLDGDALHFSSRLAPLTPHVGDKALNTDTVGEMLVYGHRASGRTIWQRLNVVLPGRLLLFRPGLPRAHWQFWSSENIFELDERLRLEKQSVRENLEELHGHLDAAVSSIGPSSLAVPCGGGVDSTLLGAFLKRAGRHVTFWCVNKPEAARHEESWMRSISSDVGIPCEYAHITRDVFLPSLIELLGRTKQPLAGPNFVGSYVLRQQAVAAGNQCLVFGELCDTLFGGLSPFHHLSPAFRLLRGAQVIPPRHRLWLQRALADEESWLLGTTQVASGARCASTAFGHLHRVEALADALRLRYGRQSPGQRMADLLTWTELRLIPASLHQAFWEHGEWVGGESTFPFAHPALVRFGLHLPHSMKRRHNHNKWLWRRFASTYIGETAAFRRKYSFPMPTTSWLNRIPELLKDGIVADILDVDAASLYASLPLHHPARWTLANVEIWGRLHCFGETADSVLARLV